MKRSHWVPILAVALVTLMVAPVAAAEAPGKTEVCHRTASGSSEWRLIAVSTKSLNQHTEHGDGLPLEEVPGSNGERVFDDSCGLIAVAPTDPGDPGDPGEDPSESETLFAIAYSDLDQDGAYDAGTDVLIAKFVDGPGPADDGVPGAGDVIVTDQYPMELGLGSFGDFGVTSHTVTSSSVSGTKCLVSTSLGSFIWDSSTTVDNYEERALLSGALSNFTDSHASGGSDVVRANPGSPSSPAIPMTTGDFDGVDDPFVEVETHCSG